MTAPGAIAHVQEGAVQEGAVQEGAVQEGAVLTTRTPVHAVAITET